MADRLHIIMPCSRPWNLPAIAKSLLQNQEEHGLEIRWHLMIQGSEPDPKGYLKVNEGLAMVKDGWCWGPSDDTLQEPTLFQRLDETIKRNPNARVIVFSEKRKGVCPWTGGAWASEPGILRAKPENMKRCRVDGTQAFFHHSVKPGFDFSKYGPEADGAYIADLYAGRPDCFVFLTEEFVTFGSLDP